MWPCKDYMAWYIWYGGIGSYLQLDVQTPNLCVEFTGSYSCHSNSSKNLGTLLGLLKTLRSDFGSPWYFVTIICGWPRRSIAEGCMRPFPPRCMHALHGELFVISKLERCKLNGPWSVRVLVWIRSLFLSLQNLRQSGVECWKCFSSLSINCEDCPY